MGCAFAETQEIETGYGFRGNLIRVDTTRKRVIIATGGQDWQLFSFSARHFGKRTEVDHPPGCNERRGSRESERFCGIAREWARGKSWMIWVLLAPSRRGVERTALVRLAQASKGWNSA